MIKSSFIKKYLGYSYSSFNYGKSGRSAKRNRRIGYHIIRQKLKREMMEAYTREASYL